MRRFEGNKSGAANRAAEVGEAAGTQTSNSTASSNISICRDLRRRRPVVITRGKPLVNSIAA